MSNEIKVTLSEEQLSKLVEQVVLKKLEEYLNKTYVIENLVRLVISEYLNANDIASNIKDIISNLAGSEDTVLSRVLDRHVEAWIKNNSNVFPTYVKAAITSLLTSQHVYKETVEPLLTKAIVDDSNFSEYLRNEVSIRLTEKIKSVTKAIGDQVSPTVIKDFLKQYTTNRFKDDHTS